MSKDNGNVYASLSFRYIFEHARSAGILILSKEGLILDSNIGVFKSFGYTRDDLVGKGFSMLFSSEDKLKNKPEIELVRLLQEGSGVDQNYIVHKNGSYIWSTGESILTKNEKGEDVIVKIIYDINEQKLLEKFLTNANEELTKIRESLSNANIELEAKNIELNKTVKDLDTFVYAASHDMKAPINNIAALVLSLYEEMDEDCREKEDVKQIVKMIEKSIDRFKNTIDDLSNIGMAQTNTMENYVRSGFNETMEDVKISLEELIKNNDAVIIEDFADAPEVNLSRKNLRSLLFNLLSNAIKYRAPDRRPEVKVSSHLVDGYVLLKVEDNGLGIREEDKEKVFSMYERIHQHVEGTGIGMGLVRKIIDNNGGKVEVDSEVGKGSVFNVYIKN